MPDARRSFALRCAGDDKASLKKPGIELPFLTSEFGQIYKQMSSPGCASGKRWFIADVLGWHAACDETEEALPCLRRCASGSTPENENGRVRDFSATGEATMCGGPVMPNRFDHAMRGLCGAGSATGACLAGIVTLILGTVCLADAFVVPGLFGPVAATVIATERLLCAARSSSSRTAIVWTGIAFGWIAVAACMLHTPSLSGSLLQWLVILPIVASAACRAVSMAESPPAAIWVIAAGIVAQLAMLFGAAAAPLARVAAAVAIELVLIGLVRLLQTARLHLAESESMLPPAQRVNTTANLSAAMSELQPGIV